MKTYALWRTSPQRYFEKDEMIDGLFSYWVVNGNYPHAQIHTNINQAFFTAHFYNENWGDLGWTYIVKEFNQ